MLVRAWQRAPAGLEAEWWALFVNETADWLCAIIRSFKRDLSSLGSIQDIRAELVLHLHDRVLPAYRPGRGKLFSLVTFACHNYIRTLLEKAARFHKHYVSAATFADDPAEPEVDSLGAAVQPEVYSLPAEIRERLDHYTAPGEDFDFFLVRNLVVYAYTRGGRVLPTLEQISQIVSEIVSLPLPEAYEQTEAAVIMLKNELADFRGRPSLHRAEPATNRTISRATQPVRNPAPCLYD